jgi:hypothetical protein
MEDFNTSKNMYRNVLRMLPKDDLKASTLANLGVASWLHHRSLVYTETEGVEDKKERM